MKELLLSNEWLYVLFKCFALIGCLSLLTLVGVMIAMVFVARSEG